MAREKILDLANKISKKERGKKGEILATDPEYMILEPIVTDEMAEVALCCAFRDPRSAEEVAPLCGKSVEKTHELLLALADAGVCFVNVKDGVDKFWYDTWIPGIMEMMVNKYSNVEKYPQIGRAMEAYGRVRGPMTAGVFPVGKGLMRVIPIEKAIMGETRRADYEEVSKYLNENDIFSVSNCSCRSTREIMGEGCGHLKEDMCIQMGHAAEYYIRTGRGRQITPGGGLRDHQAGRGKRPHAPDPQHRRGQQDPRDLQLLRLRLPLPPHRGDVPQHGHGALQLRLPRWTSEKCMACGECVEACPVGSPQAWPEDPAPRSPLPENTRKPDLPSNTVWTSRSLESPTTAPTERLVVEHGHEPLQGRVPRPYRGPGLHQARLPR